MQSQSDALLWIWLSLACGAGSPAGDLLLSTYENDVHAIYEADAQTLSQIEGLDKRTQVALLDKSLARADRIAQYCQKNNVSLLCPADPLFPPRLRAIRACPILLYYRGKLPDFTKDVCIAMVGTRHMTEYGKKAAYTIAFDLGKGGAVIVSGMAAGIDGMCHRGALDAGAHTVAILGCGIDRAYPAMHRSLMDELFQSGTVMTEFAPFTEPNGKNFPIRNRIISGLCQGTVVVEADYKSGSLITARHALYQGRDLFAVPGKIGEQTSAGTNRLLKDGAKLVTNAFDILEEYEFLYPERVHLDRIPRYLPSHPPVQGKPKGEMIPKKEEATASVPTPPPAPKAPAPAVLTTDAVALPKRLPPISTDPTEQAILSCLDRAVSLDCDSICRKSALPIATVLTALTMLEIRGDIEALPGGLYRLRLS